MKDIERVPTGNYKNEGHYTRQCPNETQYVFSAMIKKSKRSIFKIILDSQEVEKKWYKEIPESNTFHLLFARNTPCVPLAMYFA